MLRRIIGMFGAETEQETPHNLVVKTPPQPADRRGYLESYSISPDEFLSGAHNPIIPADIMNPDKTGIEVVSTEELMEANRTYIEQILEVFIDKAMIPDFDRQVLELIRRFAHWMGPLPASRATHHTGRGGLFTHSLGVATGALHFSMSRNMTFKSAPRDKDAHNLAWQLVCLICGLLHDIGKVHTIGHVYAHSVTRQSGESDQFRPSSSPVYSTLWEPMVEGFASWARHNRVRSYFIDFERKAEFEPEQYTARYVQALVPRPLLAFIYHSNKLIRQQFEDFIFDPGAASSTPIFKLVHDADHLNVTQSINPRRKPGMIELSTLVVRRFAEFAAEAQWNLPTSHFVYAHVEHLTENGYRYFGLPFFVASESSISQFLDYLVRHQTFGLSVSKDFPNVIFNALESANIMSPTIEGILNQRIPVKDMPDYIPASRADIRFRARAIREFAIRQDAIKDHVMDLPVIPVQVRVPAMATLDAPTLSFLGKPREGIREAIKSQIQAGSIVPVDPALRRDEQFMADFQNLDIPKHVEEEISKIPPAVDVDHRQGTHDGKAGGDHAAGSASHSEDQQPEKTRGKARGSKNDPQQLGNHSGPAPASNRDSQQPGTQQRQEMTAASGQSGQKDDAQHEGSTPSPSRESTSSATQQSISERERLTGWEAMFRQLIEHPEQGSAEDFWACYWLFLDGHPGGTVQAIEIGTGYFGFDHPSLPLAARQEFQDYVKSCQLRIDPITDYWPSQVLKPTAAEVSSVFDLGKDDADQWVIRLHPQIGELIETMYGEQSEEAQN